MAAVAKPETEVVQNRQFISTQAGAAARAMCQMFSMDCYFRQMWKDDRLAFEAPHDNITELRPSIKMLDEIWKPDTYFLNGQGSYLHTITYSNKLFRINTTGNTLYSQR